MTTFIIGLAVFVLTLIILGVLILLIAFKEIFLKEENVEQYRDELQLYDNAETKQG